MDNKELKSVIIGYGSNQGDWSMLKPRFTNLIEAKIGTIVDSSGTYITPAWGNSDQPDFKNGVLKVNTCLSPVKCLTELLNIEKELGRVRAEKWGPRIIDLDIIDYNQKTHKTKELTLPHPYAHERQFVLEPLCEISPDFIIPKTEKTVKELLEDLPNKTALSILK